MRWPPPSNSPASTRIGSPEWACTAKTHSRRSPSTKAICTTYPDFASLKDGLAAHEVAAIEAGLMALAGVDIHAAEPVAQRALSLGWPYLQDLAARVLGRCSSRDSFVALMDAMEVVTVAGYELSNNQYAEGAMLVVAALAKNPATAPFIAGESKPNPEFSPCQRLAAESLLQYLGNHRVTSQLPLLRRIYSEHEETYLRQAAGHALLNFGDPESLELLVDLGSRPDARMQLFAVRAEIQQDPSTGHQRLAARLGVKGNDQLLKHVTNVLKREAEHHRGSWRPADPGWVSSPSSSPTRSSAKSRRGSSIRSQLT